MIYFLTPINVLRLLSFNAYAERKLSQIIREFSVNYIAQSGACAGRQKTAGNDNLSFALPHHHLFSIDSIILSSVQVRFPIKFTANLRKFAFNKRKSMGLK